MKNYILKVFHPIIAFNKLSWLINRRKFKKVGSHVSIGPFYEFKGSKFITIGNGVVARKFLKLHAWESYKGKKTSYNPDLLIGNYTSFGDNCYITCANKIIVGNNVLIGDNVFITDNFHGKSLESDCHLPPAEREIWSKGPVIVDDNVWIGRNVSIMPNVTIGRGTVIGANSVVTKDIPEFSVAVGSPARVVRKIE
ncbi:Acetyltransferase (isoleucine patch superfamily) [Streptococcus equinus]|uniref:Acetyltransferase (Isoleucine patch superfamily) n=1 Tax=Streptococcus equinus TaxID=1335 RepID=A0A1H0XZC5_STREI|nr:acyltransferase [Streptococcus equinus]SDQ08259.1 Acetyltransferase (isoleucine patch superfamily) [Streptococcus equinus]